jgi:hypothetical protein
MVDRAQQASTSRPAEGLESLTIPANDLRNFIRGLKDGIQKCFKGLRSVWAKPNEDDKRTEKIKEWSINLGGEQQAEASSQQLFDLFDKQTQQEAVTQLSQKLLTGSEVVISRGSFLSGQTTEPQKSPALSKVRLFRAWDKSLRLQVTTVNLGESDSQETANKLEFKVGGDGPIKAEALPKILKQLLSQPEGAAWADDLNLVKALARSSWAQLVITKDSKLDNLDLRSWPLHRIRIETPEMIKEQERLRSLKKQKEEKIVQLSKDIAELKEGLEKAGIKPGFLWRVIKREDPDKQKELVVKLRRDLRNKLTELVERKQKLGRLTAQLDNLTNNPTANPSTINFLQDKAPWVQFRTPQGNDHSQVAVSLRATSIKTTDLPFIRVVERGVTGKEEAVKLKISNNPTALELDKPDKHKQGEKLKIEFKPEGTIIVTLNGKKIALKDNPTTRDKCEHLVKLFCSHDGLQVETNRLDATNKVEIKLSNGDQPQQYRARERPQATIGSLKARLRAHADNTTEFDERINNLDSNQDVGSGTPTRTQLEEQKKRDLQFVRAKLLELQQKASSANSTGSGQTQEQDEDLRTSATANKPAKPVRSLSTVLPKRAQTATASTTA